MERGSGGTGKSPLARRPALPARQSGMLAIILTLVLAFDILLFVKSARAEPGTRLRTLALVVFTLQLALGMAGGLIAMLRFV